MLALTTAATLSLTGIPPVELGCGLELPAGPLLLRADIAQTGNTAYFVATAGPWRQVGAWRLGPLIGVAATTSWNTCVPGMACSGPVAAFWKEPQVVLGARATWESDRWWFSAMPNVALGAPYVLPPAAGSTTPPPASAPNWSPNAAFIAGPPWLEVGYHITPALGVALRSSLLPIALSWRF